MKAIAAPRGARPRAIAGSASIVLAVSTFTAALPAGAQEPDEDATRFRGGIQAGLGPALFATNGQLSVVAGLTGHVGVQVNDTLGVVFAPQIQTFMGEQSGPFVGGAFLADVTVDDAWAVGLGLDMGALVPEGDGENGGGVTTAPNAGLVGRLAFYPDADPGLDGRRSGTTFGIDLHARLTGIAYLACGGCGPSGPPLMLAPTFFIGHAAY